MKRFAIVLIISMIVFIVVAMGLGRLKVYDPEHETIHIDIAKVETGNQLIGITEVNVILMIMIAGALIIFK